MSKHGQPATLLIVATSMCAALYAVGSYATAYIPSPFGFGQFRPAIIIPAFFGAIFGPLPGAIGAALGTLIADSVKHGYLYPGSYLAAVPGNFVGFLIFGYVLRKRFNWSRFISATVITLAVANLIVAFLYVFAFKVLYTGALTLPTEALTYLSLGLTIYWFVTMLPFALLVTPPLIRAVSRAMPSIVPEQVRVGSLEEEIPKTSFSLAMIIPGVTMVLIGLATTFTPLGPFTISAAKLSSTLLIELMYYLGGGTLIAIGAIVLVKQMTEKP